jgi:putative phosphoesterase
MLAIGVISDTHGLMRPEALAALRDSDLILHAGDIGSQAVLDELKAIAKVKAIRGNNDDDPWAAHLPTTLRFRCERASIYVLHDRKALEIDPVAKKIAVVVSGHSHRPSIETRDGVLFLNPGSAGPRRFKLPITVAKLTIAAASARAQIVTLDT